MTSAPACALRLTGITTRAFPPGIAYQPPLLEFYADLAAEYGLPRPELAEARMNSFTAMVAAVLPELTLPPRVGLALLAHHTPDAEPLWPSSFLASELPGRPLSFAVADHGVTAAFTALRIAAAYAPADEVLLFVLDQTTVVHDRTAPPGTIRPAQDRVAVLSFTPAAGGPGAEDLPDVAPEDVGEHLRRLGVPGTVVVGSSLAGLAFPAGTDVRVAPGGLPCTGVWTALADVPPGRDVLVADYDPALRHLGLCRLSTPH